MSATFMEELARQVTYNELSFYCYLELSPDTLPNKFWLRLELR
jgi:hypothetical protein